MQYGFLQMMVLMILVAEIVIKGVDKNNIMYIIWVAQEFKGCRDSELWAKQKFKVRFF